MKRTKGFSRDYSVSLLFALSAAAFLLLSSLPADAALQASAHLSDTRVALNKPFELLLTVTWEGPADEYAVEPPAPELPEGVELLSSSFDATVSSQAQKLTYRFVLQARSKGAFELNPVEIKYWQQESGQERFVQTGKVAFEAGRPALPGPKSLWAGIAAGAGLLCVLAALSLIARRRARRKTRAGNTSSEPGRELFRERLQQCRRYKLQGDYRNFYECASGMAEAFSPEDTAFRGMLTDTLEQVRFGGYRPSAEEIDRIFRQLEKQAGGKSAEKKERALEEISRYCR